MICRQHQSHDKANRLYTSILEASMDQEWSLEGHHTGHILLPNNYQVKQLVDVCHVKYDENHSTGS